MDSARKFRDYFRRLPNRQRRALDYFVELAAFNELHAEVTRAVTVAYLIDWHDTWMIETCGSFGFPTKPLQVVFASPLTETDDFEGDYAVESLLSRPEHHALPAPTDFFQQLIVAQ